MTKILIICSERVKFKQPYPTEYIWHNNMYYICMDYICIVFEFLLIAFAFVFVWIIFIWI